MSYNKEKQLLDHYNSNPQGGTTIKDPLLLDYVFKLIGIHISPMDKVLDLGCASGVISDLIINHYGADVTGVDSSFARILIGKTEHKNVEFIEQDMHEFVDTTRKKFDLIILFDTLEHLEDPKDLVDRAKRLLNKDGIIYAKTPLEFPYEAHLQVFNDKADFDSRLKPTKSIVYSQSIISIWQ